MKKRNAGIVLAVIAIALVLLIYTAFVGWGTTGSGAAIAGVSSGISFSERREDSSSGRAAVFFALSGEGLFCTLFFLFPFFFFFFPELMLSPFPRGRPRWSDTILPPVS